MHPNFNRANQEKKKKSTNIDCLFVPCLSEYRNDSTGEIIFKVWLLIKQGIQELWRSYSINDVV